MISLSLRQTSAASIFEHSAEPFLAAVSLPDGRAGRDCISTTLLTTLRVHATRFASSLFEGRLRRHPEGGAGREARPREPKTATVERREASVPRHGTQGASLGA